MYSLLFVVSAFLTSAFHTPEADFPLEKRFPASVQNPQKQFLAIKSEYEETLRSFFVKYRAAKNEEEKNRVRKSYPKIDAYAHRMLKLAEEFPSDPVACDALIWIVNNYSGGVELRKLREKVLKTLVKDHIRNIKVGVVCSRLEIGFASEDVAFLRSIKVKTPHKEVRDRALLSLARTFKNKADAIVGLHQLKHLDPDAFSEMVIAMEKLNGKNFIRELLNTDPQDLYAEAERDFAHVIRMHSETIRRNRKPGDMATSDLYEIRNLTIGKVAPNIKGEDANGIPFELKDFRGRVVVLVFSGVWCAPCRAMYPQERSLVKRLKEKPFALLGISSDQNRDTLTQAKKKGQITWRCWWDGGGSSGGKIAKKWNIKGWPKIFVLDHHGVIRYKGHEELKGDALDKAIDELLDGLEKDKIAD